jgi:hypothetical protein
MSPSVSCDVHEFGLAEAPPVRGHPNMAAALTIWAAVLTLSHRRANCRSNDASKRDCHGDRPSRNDSSYVVAPASTPYTCQLVNSTRCGRHQTQYEIDNVIASART